MGIIGNVWGKFSTAELLANYMINLSPYPNIFQLVDLLYLLHINYLPKINEIIILCLLFIYHFEIDNRSYYLIFKIILNILTNFSNVTLVPNFIFIKHKICIVKHRIFFHC